MKKLSCVIVDDEPMAREILESYILKSPNLDLQKICKNASEAILHMQNSQVDLYFLDINMPEISGLSLAKIIKNNSKIIFTTAYRDYAIEGFNLNIVDYLLKPFSFDRFMEAVEKVANTKDKIEDKHDFMFVRSDRKMIKIDFDAILYIESLSDYIKIYLEDKTVVCRETISNFEEKLPNQLFIRTHRSFIAAIRKINSYTNEFLEIKDKAVPISRSYKESVLDKLADV
ncbi:LytR/AlgR family response regulator transcription factor [Polaribacter dokdonensis]|jgi:two-component system, LytTR family, response regulator|uniref:Two component transcriptional regulator, LytTR family n=1 Tax=Polaribacter dokdonensis DSW-5 TaxID=1300348 RepID=A0A0M9CEZ3_9FLAO|nr:LytTR family DNA-binding domain-containing protein [Polaribacter dokdonensis]KOY51133.1 Two-component system response regulator, LytR/AlgR family [Polaribacter dokdonensis DSW-5]SEE18014.1 two component transcriptional regulator, LytTR family [Polaribacter dokdonensis DSW-5]